MEASTAKMATSPTVLKTNERSALVDVTKNP